MAKPLEVIEDEAEEATARLIEVQKVWEARVREGDDNTETLFSVAAEITVLKGMIRELRASIAARAAAEKGGDE